MAKGGISVSDRESFLQRVRQAVTEGNRAGGSPPLPQRGTVGYQGAGPDPLARLGDEFTAAGGQPHFVPDAATAVATVLRLLRERGARRVLLGGGTFLDSLDLQRHLHEIGIEVTSTASPGADQAREAFFAADVGITGV